MEPTIWRFLAFLGSELLFCVAAGAVLILVGFLVYRSGQLKGPYVVLAGFLTNIVSLVFLFMFTWILTGKAFISLFAAIASISIALGLAVELAWLIIGPRNVPWVGQAIWTQHEFQTLLPRVGKFVHVATLLGMLAYPVYIGYGYFGNIFHSEDWPRYVIQTTLVVLVGFFWALQLPQNLYIMTSRNLIEDTRTRIFIAQLGSSVSLLMLVSLLLWTLKGAGATVIPLGEYFVFSSTVAYVVVAYMLLFLIIPYLIGHYRSRGWIESLVGERKEILEALSKGLVHPNVAKASEVLQNAEQRVEAAIQQVGKDGSLDLARQIRDSDDPGHILHQIALREIDKRDPRFVHVSQLGEIGSLLSDCKTELGTKADDKDKREVFGLYAKAFDKERELQKELQTPSRPLVLVALTALAGALMNPIWSLAAKFAAGQLGIGPLPE